MDFDDLDEYPKEGREWYIHDIHDAYMEMKQIRKNVEPETDFSKLDLDELKVEWRIMCRRLRLAYWDKRDCDDPVLVCIYRDRANMNARKRNAKR